MSRKQKHKNYLALMRKKNALGQKQVAALLGHNSIDQISRYERGVKIPSLEIALKFGIIYKIPLQVLFYGYRELCLNEMQEQAKNFAGKDKHFNLTESLDKQMIEFCSFEEKLKPAKVADTELTKAGAHVTQLIHLRSEKAGHLTPREK